MRMNNTKTMNGFLDIQEDGDISLELTLGLGGYSTASTSASIVNIDINSPVERASTSFELVPVFQQSEREREQASASASTSTAADKNNGGNRSENETSTSTAADKNNGGNRSENGNGRQRSRTAYAQDNEIIPIPYPWATDRLSKIHDLNTLMSRKIYKISGEVQCRRCERRYSMEYDLMEKFVELSRFLELNIESMHQRAPRVWMSPVLPNCRLCNQENSVKPIISDNKQSINWLFLLLGQMLGCCTLEQLKYFCKYAKNHRTGAKDRVLYLTYMTLLKQLDGHKFDN